MAQRMKVSRGDVLTAEKWNLMVDALERIEGVLGINDPKPGDGGPWVLRARITAINGLTDVPNRTGPISSVTYDVMALGQSTATMTGAIPWNRLVSSGGGGSATIVQAPAVGAPAFIFRMPDGTGGLETYLVVAETLYVQVCPA